MGLLLSDRLVAKAAELIHGLASVVVVAARWPLLTF